MSSAPVDDSALLESLGYAQELKRGMSGFSNFAIAFSVICILAGGITSLQLGLCSVGGASVGIGWPLSCLFSVCVALSMGQVASAFPTAGGLYHWASILGGRGAGWVTAWFNLVGLVTVISAINVGAYKFAAGAFGWPDTMALQVVVVTAITGAQCLMNHLGIRLTTLLTDCSGYLIFFVSTVLTVALLHYASSLDLSRLWTFQNFSGPAGGDVWPATGNLAYLFLLGLLLPAYTVTGFDASAHTAEETVNAARAVPRGMLSAVLISSFFGYLMLCAIVLAIPDMAAAAAQGGNIFYSLMQQVIPGGLRLALYVGIAISQFLCGLATVTSASRMVYAFARDGGLPRSELLREVNPTYLTPVNAIWTIFFLSVAFTIYTPVYSTITVVCTIFLYISYVLPIAMGLVAYRRSWRTMGPWDLGPWFRLVAAVSVLGCATLLFIGFQPPNDKAFWITLGALLLTGCVWFGYERSHFRGPPQALVRK